jgi:glycosyltransferase involved in cell wall biosynthesis
VKNLKEKIAVVHALFDVIGGGEKLALTTVDSMIKSGYDVTIITGTDVDKEKIKLILGSDISNIKIIRIVSKTSNYLAKLTNNRSVRLRRVAIYRKIFNKSIYRKIKNQYDLIIDTQTNLPSPSDIAYIHFPATIGTSRKRNFIEKIYDEITYRYSLKLTKTRPGKTLTNSKWTANKIYKEFNIIPEVVYPPVDLQDFLKIAYKDHKEKNVITISRFSPEKSLDKILNFAKKFPDYNFYLIGSTTPRLSDNLLNYLKEEIKKLQLKNVFLMPDLPRNEMLKLMSESKIYLHPPFAEHFGISIVEAMASGLIPVVYKDGGAWTDIVSNVDRNLGYIDTDWEIALKYATENEEKLREKSVEFSKNFSREKFEERILNVIDYALEIKKI